MSLSTRSRLRRTATALSIVLALATVSCGSDGRSGEQQSAENGPDVAHTDDPNADKIVAIVRDKLTELDLSGAVFGVWRGDEEIAAGAVGSLRSAFPRRVTCNCESASRWNRCCRQFCCSWPRPER